MIMQFFEYHTTFTSKMLNVKLNQNATAPPTQRAVYLLIKTVSYVGSAAAHVEGVIVWCTAFSNARRFVNAERFRK